MGKGSPQAKAQKKLRILNLMIQASATLYADSSLFILRSSFSNQLWQEARDNEYYDAKQQYADSCIGTAFPLLEDDAPYIGENHVESHQDAESQRGEHWRGYQKSLA